MPFDLPQSATPDTSNGGLVWAFGLGIMTLLSWLVRTLVTRLSDGLSQMVTVQREGTQSLNKLCETLADMHREDETRHKETRAEIINVLQRSRSA